MESSAFECSACSAVQCSGVQCSAVQSSPVQCSAVQCSALQCSAVQSSAVQCSAVQCSAVQCVWFRPPHSTADLFLTLIWLRPLRSTMQVDLEVAKQIHDAKTVCHQLHVSAKQLLPFFSHISAEHLLVSAGVIFATSCRYADMLLRICGHILDLSARHVLTFMQTCMQRCM